MTTWQAHNRVKFTRPGKHGDKDIKVQIGHIAPSHAELLAMLWGVLRAEDRYDAPHQHGRQMLVGLVGEICGADTWADAKPIVERAKWSVENRRAA